MPKKISVDEKGKLSASHEDYLKAIYLLGAQSVPVTNSALAEHLAVSPASATNMVKKLGELGLVNYEKYREITLNPAGRRVALEVLRHHRLLELYLHDRLHLTWDQVHEEAERLEHVMSDVLEDAIAAALGNPTTDPHGDPIPTKDGRIERVEGLPLSQVEPGRSYRLVRVLVQDAERLAYLGEMGLYPNAQIVLRKRSPFDGPLLIEVESEPYALAHSLAKYLLVTPAE